MNKRIARQGAAADGDAGECDCDDCARQRSAPDVRAHCSIGIDRRTNRACFIIVCACVCLCVRHGALDSVARQRRRQRRSIATSETATPTATRGSRFARLRLFGVAVFHDALLSGLDFDSETNEQRAKMYAY